jgi:hypothetical protein
MAATVNSLQHRKPVVPREDAASRDVAMLVAGAQRSLLDDGVAVGYPDRHVPC